MALLTGIHHITAIASDPQTNIDFYAGVLGLRLVKVTVNFDDPGTYHLYYGDYAGSPGTILTFFPWPGVQRGVRGHGEVVATAYSAQPGTEAYWRERLTAHQVAVREEQRFGQTVFVFADPDGMAVEIAFTPDAREGFAGGPVPAEAALRGFHSATVAISQPDQSLALLTDGMGFRAVEQQDGRQRFAVAEGGPHQIVDVVAGHGRRGMLGAGSVHHIAWRTPDDAQQRTWLQELSARGQQVTPVQDRKYFHSIYYREPSGILYEIATDPPGFAIDEPVEALGRSLVLPPWLEPRRSELVRVLPKLSVLSPEVAA